ncbi:SRPBCC domain-containing protein [Undibacterium curvum]|uniref:SRPBCC domain-containing protein n=1 Tax=Undibacterium curvum TaxID=2762294 RepID=A0ABR7A8X6_9BURK|nr:SRPBCC domain-containing protein [Undibacterium curvum]MBC3933363.1 SRPBCC domain-containing protein [Undibacterium curvum]
MSNISVSVTIKATPEQVWQAYTTPQDIMQWNAASADWHTTAAQVDLRVGGTFSSRMEAKDGSHGFDFAGVYTEVVPCKRLAYCFGERQAQVDFVTQADSSVLVTVTFEPENVYPREQQQQGWQAILDNFARYVEAAA